MAQIPDATIEIKQVSLKWEYLCTWLNFDEQKDLTELGQLGWELVTILLVENEAKRAYFKRIWNPE